MNQSFFKSFNSPYHAFAFASNRYRRAIPWLAGILIILPILFLLFRSFSVYFVAQVVIFILFPLFIWADLNVDAVTDIKLDVLKVFAVGTLYATYLLILAWVMLAVFQPELKIEYMLINIGYIFLLLITGYIVAAASLFHRYAQKIIRDKKI